MFIYTLLYVRIMIELLDIILYSDKIIGALRFLHKTIDYSQYNISSN
jgi:hypothetical protein